MATNPAVFTQRAQDIQNAGWQQQDQQKQETQRLALAPHIQAIPALQQRLALYADPTDPTKAQQGHEAEYAAAHDALADTIGNMREILHPPPAGQPSGMAYAGERLMDKLHITRDLAARAREKQQGKVDAYNTQGKQGDQKQATAYAQAVPPTDWQKVTASFQAATGRAPTPEEASAWAQKQAGIPEPKAKYSLVQGTVDGKPVTYQRNESNPSDLRDLTGTVVAPEMAAKFSATAKTGASSKPIKGPVVPSKQSPTGFAQTYLDPLDPNKQVAWQPVAANRYQAGSTGSSTSVDSMGVKTSTSRSQAPNMHGDVDLAKITQLPEHMNDDEVAAAVPTPPPSAETPAATADKPKPAAAGPKAQQLKKTSTAVRSGQPAKSGQLDAHGLIPESSGVNPQMREAANQLLDGKDIDHMGLSPRDRPAVAALARQYGWEQGMFTPREMNQIGVATTFLNQLKSSASLSVLDSTASRLKIAHVLDPKTGPTTKAILSKTLTPDEAEFIRNVNIATGTVQGLAQITRSGRANESAVKRLQTELPSILQSPNASDARSRIDNLLKEVEVATKGKGGSVPRGTSDDAVDNFLKNLPKGS